MKGMRITGGQMRGRVVPAPKGSDVRPTSSRVREALFSMVGQELSGWTALDAFGGSGLLGFEAFSRGASVTMVEHSRDVALTLQNTAKKLGVELDLRIGDVGRVFGTGTWDLVLLDPPYADDAATWLQRAAPAVGRVLVIECASDSVLPARVEGLERDRSRTYGGTALTIYRRVG
jgi:16S rRNA (guanine966-N2)-methyltransferase